MNIRLCEPKDVHAICEIYNYYIENTVITFEDVPVSLVDMSQRIERYTTLFPWFVCELEGMLVGYAYATKWKERAAYKNSAEITVYVKQSQIGQGVGKALYTALIAALDKTHCHVILGCISLPNDSSVGLHEHFGFKKVAHFSEVGYKFNRWIDIGYWQKINPLI